MHGAPTLLEGKAQSFDVICAGEALWAADDRARLHAEGAIRAAIALARQGLSVGLATVLPDDTAGRALRAQIDGANVGAEGVALTRPRSGLFVVAGGDAELVSRDEGEPIAIPSGWSSQVLLLSGVSPVVAHAAATCRAARAARRAGTTVVLDLNARWQLWKGRDSRSIRMILREADVVWSSAEDLLGLNLDLPTLRAAARPGAILAMSDGFGAAWATGPFGEVVRAVPPPVLRRDGDSFAIGICAELVRARHDGSGEPDTWVRALDYGLRARASR